MAKASKYNRARIRSRVRRPKRRGGSMMWSVLTAVIVVVGVALVVWSVADRKDASATPPKLGDHWHSYLGVNVCGEWLVDAPEFHPRAGEAGVNAGLHSHGDGLIHVHPFGSDETGDNATVGRFIDYGGWQLSGSSFTLWDGQEHKNGQKCGEGADAKPAEVQWTVGRFGEPWKGTPRTGNPADYKPRNGDIIAIYLLPKGEKLEEPPKAEDSLTSISDLGGAPVSGPGTTVPTAPGETAPPGTETTVPTAPPATDATTSSTP
jgi:hypothetical protein